MSGSEQDSYAKNKERARELDGRKAQIRQLNDRFRQTLTGGRVMITSGVRALGAQRVEAIVLEVCRFSSFTSDNDPHEEHDFGAISCGGHQIFWKIDCYDKRLECGSPDPADPAVTTRVITIMLASKY